MVVQRAIVALLEHSGREYLIGTALHCYSIMASDTEEWGDSSKDLYDIRDNTGPQSPSGGAL